MNNFFLHRRTLILALLVSAFSTAGYATEATPDTISDVRCLVAASVSIGMTNDLDLQESFRNSIFYYLGRLDGRASELDIQQLSRTELKKMSPKDIAVEDMRCGKEFALRGDLLSSMGQSLQKETSK